MIGGIDIRNTPEFRYGRLLAEDFFSDCAEALKAEVTPAPCG